MDWIIIILLFIAVIVAYVVIPMIIETKSEKKNIATHELNEIFDCRAEGLCESCKHGIGNCIKEGKAYCKQNGGKDYVKEMLI